MDTNALQESMQIYREPRRKELILEARHSKCIEASNKIRSKLSPRLFMPRAPIYRHTTRTHQHCPKELKSKCFKSQNFKNFPTNTTDFAKDTTNLQKKCQQTPNSENFLKKSRGKYTKRAKRDQNFKTMDNIMDNSFKRPKLGEQQKRTKESKRMKKQQGLAQIAMKSHKSLNSSINKKSKEDVKGKLGNLKVIANENATDNSRFMTDGEIIFLKDKDKGDLRNYWECEGNRTVKTTATYYFESPNNSRGNSQQTGEENRQRVNCEQSKISEQNSERTTNENQSKSQTKTCRYAKKSLPTSSHNRENSLGRSVQISAEYSNQNSEILRDLPTATVFENPPPNSTESSRTHSDIRTENTKSPQNVSKEYTCEKIRNYLRLQNTAKEYNRKLLPVEDYREPIDYERYNPISDQAISTESTPVRNSTTTTATSLKPNVTDNDSGIGQTVPLIYVRNLTISEDFNKLTTVSNIEEHLRVNPENSTKANEPPNTQQNSTQSATIPKPSNSTITFKPYLKSNEPKNTASESKATTYPTTILQTPQLSHTENKSSVENSFLQLPIQSYLNRASSAVSEFQETIHASMSLIYDCSTTDKSIQEDLVNLESSVESFNKFLMQSINAIELMDLKTINSVDYLNRKNVNRILQDLQTRSSSLNNPTNSSNSQETLTILIEADKMPTKTITFKTSDIICPKPNSSDNEGRSKNNSTAAAQDSNKNLKRKNSNIAIVSNIKLTNNDILKQIMPNLKTSPLNKEIGKRPQEETSAIPAFKENPITSLQTFVEESMQRRPVHSIEPGYSFKPLGEAITKERNSFNENYHISSKNLNKTYANQTLTENRDQQNRLKYIRRKITPRKTPQDILNISKSNSQRLATEIPPKIPVSSRTVNEMRNTSLMNRNLYKSGEHVTPTSINPYNLIYTQAQTNCTSYETHNSLRLYRIPNHHHQHHLPKSITSQASSQNQVTLTNSYNHSRVSENSPKERISSKCLPNYPPYLYPYNAYPPNREHQVPNETTPLIAPNQYHSHDHSFYKPSNYVFNKERNTRNSLHSMEVPYNSGFSESFLHNPYLSNPHSFHHYPDLRLYNRPFPPPPPTHYPVSRDFERRHHTRIPPHAEQPFPNSEFQNPND